MDETPQETIVATFAMSSGMEPSALIFLIRAPIGEKLRRNTVEVLARSGNQRVLCRRHRL